MQSDDGGHGWTTVEGEALTLPLDSAQNPCLVHDAQSEGKLVYLRDLKYSEDGWPVILYVTSNGYEPGPERGPHQWNLARWRPGAGWQRRVIFESDNNYDHGALWIGPMLSARSDTFSVRAFGEFADSKAWCEITVQRVPEFVDSEDDPWTSISGLSDVNQTFGRRFEIVSFRWLNEEDL